MFTLTIKTSNAAFEEQPAEEVADLLREVVASLEYGDTTGVLRDHNGNTVGSFELTEDSDE